MHDCCDTYVCIFTGYKEYEKRELSYRIVSGMDDEISVGGNVKLFKAGDESNLIYEGELKPVSLTKGFDSSKKILLENYLEAGDYMLMVGDLYTEFEIR